MAIAFIVVWKCYLEPSAFEKARNTPQEMENM